MKGQSGWNRLHQCSCRWSQTSSRRGSYLCHPGNRLRLNHQSRCHLCLEPDLNAASHQADGRIHRQCINKSCCRMGCKLRYGRRLIQGYNTHIMSIEPNQSICAAKAKTGRGVSFSANKNTGCQPLSDRQSSTVNMRIKVGPGMDSAIGTVPGGQYNLGCKQRPSAAPVAGPIREEQQPHIWVSVSVRSAVGDRLCSPNHRQRQNQNRCENNQGFFHSMKSV